MQNVWLQHGLTSNRNCLCPFRPLLLPCILHLQCYAQLSLSLSQSPVFLPFLFPGPLLLLISCFLHLLCSDFLLSKPEDDMYISLFPLALLLFSSSALSISYSFTFLYQNQKRKWFLFYVLSREHSGPAMYSWYIYKDLLPIWDALQKKLLDQISSF